MKTNDDLREAKDAVSALPGTMPVEGSGETPVPMVAGYCGGWVDQILMRLTDLFLVVPAIAVLAMAQKGLSGKSLPLVGKLSSTQLIIGILSFLFWQTIARVTRGLFLSLKEKEYVEAAKASGASSFRIITRHILPNII